MHVMALPAGLRRFTLADLPRQRWRNGMGWTRAVASDGLADQVNWRVSLAEISQGAPFSHFAGMDRTAVLVHGGPVCLHSPDRRWPLSTPGDMARFPGEATLHNDAPIHDALIWNVMTRRGQAVADVQCHRDGLLALGADAHTLVWVMAGRFVLHDAQGHALCTLDEAEGLHRQPVPVPNGAGHAASLILSPMSPDAHLVCTRLA